MEETISLIELLETLRKRLIMIVLITITAVFVSGVVSYFFITPIYQASTQILVNQTNNDQNFFNTNEVQTNIQLINTYNVIIKSPAILNIVAKELKNGMTAGQINKEITVTTETNSQVINLAVEDRDLNRAVKIANTISTVFRAQIPKIMKVDNVSILSEATITNNQAPVKPRPVLNMAIALVVGLMAGVGIAFLLEYLDNTVKSEQEIEKLLGLSILGAVGSISDARLDEKVRRSHSKKQVRGENFGS